MYRLELIMGQGVTREDFGLFLQALGDVALAWRLLGNAETPDRWCHEPRPHRAEAWIREFDAQSWADVGTALFITLTTLAGQAHASAWQVLGHSAEHQDFGLRLLVKREAGWIEVFRLP